MVGLEPTPITSQFVRLPSVRRTVSKLSGEKAKRPWIGLLFRYQERLSKKGCFKSVEELLYDCGDAQTQVR